MLWGFLLSLILLNMFKYWLIESIILFAAKDGDALYSQKKQDQELTVAQIMYSLLQNSYLNWRK